MDASLPDDLDRICHSALEAALWTRAPMPRVDTAAAFLNAVSAILMAPRCHLGLEVLARCGALDHFLPEVAALVGFGDEVHHKNVWEHTKQVVVQSPPRLVVRWAALLHDIGKVPTRRFTDDGQVTFAEHPEVGTRMFGAICRRLPFPRRAARRIRLLIREHQRPGTYTDAWTDSAVRRFDRKVGDSLGDLLDLARADITTRYDEKVAAAWRTIRALAHRIAALRAEDAARPVLPTGFALLLAEAIDVAPGPMLGSRIREIHAAIARGELPNRAQADVYLAYARDRWAPSP